MIAITGTGLITPLGGNCEETFQSLLEGKFITCDSRAKFADGQGGNVNQLALAAAREALGQAGWEDWAVPSAIIAGTSKGDIESWIEQIDNLQADRPAAYPWGTRLGLGDLAATVAEKLGAGRCIRLTYSAACASALHALIRAVMMIRSGEVERALVVAAESSLHPLFLACFDRLGVLAKAGEPCRPFDVYRRGFHVSQCAAAVCLESSQSAQGRGIATIERIGLAGDAFHITGSDPTAATLAKVLKCVVGPDARDLIHAHGTGTVANDAAELAAISSVLCSLSPCRNVYSHKAALGHSLGASGLVSLVLSCMMHQRGVVLPNICTADAIAHEKLAICRVVSKRPIQRSVVISSGFGGAIGVVGLRSD
ncbi:MAG TPA: beta-ketoacyl synthase N-terminal-like domain-containing protein [Tepidisphaeraceae bacterium]|jgi:3-oxoacyl-[acyl-carrier-protein] synthase II